MEVAYIKELLKFVAIKTIAKARKYILTKSKNENTANQANRGLSYDWDY